MDNDCLYIAGTWVQTKNPTIMAIQNQAIIKVYEFIPL